ncbi:MAG TPA: dihydrofolate reductase family protein [Trueperaceae bacterium]
MARLRFTISMSLDGYVAGPDQRPDQALGRGGESLHDWVVRLRSWREMHGMEGGAEGVDDEVVRESTANVGATIMGRNMFGGHPGPWDAEKPWRGWWGDRPPFKHQVFVITHHPREPLRFDNGTTFNFVTDGIDWALEQAKRAAGGGDVALGGGADVANQYLAAGLVDEMELHVVPILLGGGARLLDDVGTDMHGLRLVRAVQGEDVVHLRFAR